MRILTQLCTLLLLAAVTFACGADGELDENLLRDYAKTFQEEVMPTKEEFRKMSEEQIAKLPADEQAEARADLEKALAEWPTDEDFDNAINEIVENAPSRAEIDEALGELKNQFREDGELSEAFRELRGQLADDGELGQAMDDLAAKLSEGGEFDEALNNLIKELPQGEEVNGMLEQALGEMAKSVDSLRRAKE